MRLKRSQHKLRRHHSDDGVLFTIKRDASAYNAAVGRESLRPQLVTEHRDAFAAIVLIRDKRASDQRLHAKQGEEICGDPYGANAFGQSGHRGKTRASIFLRGRHIGK